MNQKLYEECPACGRNGLSIGTGRRRCRHCHKEVPGEHDRVIYLACETGVEYVQDKGYFLGHFGMVTPFFDRHEAEAYLAGDRYDRKWEPLTVQGHAGMVSWDYSHSFRFILEKLVELIVPRGETTEETHHAKDRQL